VWSRTRWKTLKEPASVKAAVARLSTLIPMYLALAAPARAQEQDVGAWLAFAGQGHLDRQNEGARWRWWFDAHARFFNDSDGFDQSIVRPGVGFDVSENATAWLGYAWIYSDPAQASAFDEHRLWQQFTWTTPLDVNTFFGRSRLEQRFVEGTSDVGWRFRQFLRLTRPLEPRSRHGLRVWDELFFDLNDTSAGADSGFSQNRLFAGLGWTLDEAEHFTLEYGYLNQFIPHSGAPDAMNHILAIQLILSM
jgi:hypothetical protein